MQRILGQDRAIDILQDALRSERVHHAWIFAGPRGVGKFTTAVEFARIILDPAAGPDLSGAVAADPSGRTSALIDAGTHPDLHVIRKELALDSDVTGLDRRKLMNIPLDLLREHMIGGKTGDDRYREAPAYRKPMLGHGKVFIVDEAELIDENGQNALLKTLEEPPSRTFLILVTSRVERMLPTVLSRCQLVRFGTLDAAALGTWFEQALPDLDAAERTWIESFCAGAPGMATLAAEYGFAAWQQTLEPYLAELERGDFPVAMGQTLADFANGFAEAWVKSHKNASKDAANKDGAAHVFAVLAAHARRHLVGDMDAVEPWLARIDAVRDAERQLASNVNMKHVFENLVVQWTNVPAGV
jgi:DNA polymerase-3 subunit delta'